MKYLDKYPNCIGCPVKKWCGTMISCTRLCKSYRENKKETKMNYEERYKKALKVIEELYTLLRYQSSTDALLDSQTIEKAFPELRESEDERIRKEIISYIKSSGAVTNPNWIAWLEKQGEQKPMDLFFADEEEMLTEFEKELQIIISEASHWTSDDGSISTYCQFGDKEIKKISGQILDLARKELEANYYTKVLDDRMVFKSNLHDRNMQGAYELGKQDALKDLPKWKKVDSNPPKFQYNLQGKRLYKDGEYYIELSDLEALPKEE